MKEPIYNLYKFTELPFKTVFFSRIYRLTGRAGQLGAIDQLLKIYPNCLLGVYAHGVEAGITYLEIYLIFYRITQNKVTGNDIVYTTILMDGDGFYVASDVNAIMLGETNPELYFFDGALNDNPIVTDQAFRDEQRILFNNNLEKVETAEQNIEKAFLEDDVKILNSIKFNAPLTPEMVNKVQSIAKR